MSEYQNRYVAFLDILGFKQIVEQSAKNESILRDLISITTEIEIESEKLNGKEGALGRVDIIQFSDSIILSCNQDALSFSKLLHFIDVVTVKLLLYGVLLRGGVSVGNLYHHGAVAFGPAFIQAYVLETTAAKFPRVVISSSVFASLQTLAAEKEIAKNILSTWFVRDGSGVVFINPFTSIEHHLKSEDEDDKAHGRELCLEIKRRVEGAIAHVTDQPDVFAKYQWFSERFNIMVGENIQANQTLLYIDLLAPLPGHVDVPKEGFLAFGR